MTPRDNFFAFMKGEDYEWTPCNEDVLVINPIELHDHKARGMVRQQAPFDREHESGGLGWFGVNWQYVNQVGGSMSIGRMMDDISEWKDKIVFPNLDDYDWEGIAKKNADYLKTDKIIQTTVFCGFFERLISFVEFEDAALALIDPDQEDTVNELFDKLTDLYIDYIGRMKKYFGVEFVELHDDWGNQRAEMFSINTHKEMIFPYIKRIVDYCHENGIIYLQHSCGNIANLFPNFLEAGIDTWMGQEIEGLKWSLVQKYGDKFIFQVGLVPEKGADEETTKKYMDELLAQYKPYKVWFRFSPNDVTREQGKQMAAILRTYKR